MGDSLTSDQAIQEAIDEAKEVIRSESDNMDEAIKKALDLISFANIGPAIAAGMGQEFIPPGGAGLPQVMRKTGMEMLGGKEKLEESGLTEVQINEKVVEMIAYISFVSLSLASIASGNLIPSPPSFAVAKKYYDILGELLAYADNIENVQNNNNADTGRTTIVEGVL